MLCFCEQFDPELSPRQFGVEVSRLTNDERTVPLVVEKLINYIEMHGLYTEGIYRKSGSTNKIRELKQGLDIGKLCCQHILLVVQEEQSYLSIFKYKNSASYAYCVNNTQQHQLQGQLGSSKLGTKSKEICVW